MSAYRFEPLEKRTYKYKKSHIDFYCPLCATKRSMVTNPHFSAKTYLQMSLITMAITACFYPLMGFKGIFSFFVVWGAFEAFFRLSFRKEVPCPHCGFDASWYKKDVKVARQKVEDFWANKPKPEIGEEGAARPHTQSDVPDLDEVASNF